MGNIATNTDEQINILKRRGMNFDCNLEKVKEHLLDIGYYRLGFYWNPFEKDKQHNFEPDTKFSNVIKLYYLDFDLGFLLMKALNRIEVHIRTQMVYHLSNKYRENPTWFVDPKVVKRDFIDDFSRNHYKNLKKYSRPIQRHHKKHLNDRFAPAWKTLEFMSLGSIFKLYINLRSKEDKELVANQFGIKSVKLFTNYFQALKNLRNICAHGGLLYDSNSPFAIIPSIFIHIKSKERHSLYANIQVVLFFLGVVSENRKADLIEQLEMLFNEHSENKTLVEILESKVVYKFN